MKVSRSVHQERELSPRASSLVESLRDMGYSLQTALADVIDNSIAAGSSSIHLLADTHDSKPAIGILDDGIGMTEKTLLEAMRPGTRSPLETREPLDLGRFGLGLKTASFSQCRRLTVVSRRARAVSCVVWDLDTVANRDRWIVEVPANPDQVRWVNRLQNDGTLVVWEKLDRLLGSNRPEDRQNLVRLLNDAAVHVEFVFHRFLSGREGRRIEISLNDRKLNAFDPFHSSHVATQHHQEETIRLDGGEIRIWPVTLPHHDKVSSSDWKKFGGSEGYVSNQGFYLYRNRRLIVHGTWFRLARKLELTKLARVGIDIPNTLDSDWKIDVKKASAQPPASVRRRLGRIIERIGVPSRLTYTSRGTKLTEESRLPVWRRFQDKNQVVYKIDEEHPLIAKFKGDLVLDQAQKFGRILRLLASTFPVDALHVDAATSPEDVNVPQIEHDDLQEIISSIRSILQNEGLSIREIEQRLKTAEPFRSNWNETSDILRTFAVRVEDCKDE